MDVRARISTAELEGTRNLLQSSGWRVAALETEVTDCHKDFSELASSKDVLDGKLEAPYALLNEVLYIRTLQSAGLRNL